MNLFLFIIFAQCLKFLQVYIFIQLFFSFFFFQLFLIFFLSYLSDLAQYLSQCSNTYKYFDLIDHKFDLKIPPNTRPLFSLEETIRRFLQSTMDPTDLNLLIDFLRCILVVDPKSRISPKDALLHPFLKD